MKPALVYYVVASLDGYIARPDGQVDWLQEAEDTDDDHGYTAFYAGIDGLLMGRATYDVVRSFGSNWPYTGKPCLVLARNSLEQTPSGVQGRHCTPGEALDELSGRGCRRVWLVGGGSLAGNCLAADQPDSLAASRGQFIQGLARRAVTTLHAGRRVLQRIAREDQAGLAGVGPVNAQAAHHVVGGAAHQQAIDALVEGFVAVILAGGLDAFQPVHGAIRAGDIAIQAGGNVVDQLWLHVAADQSSTFSMIS